MKLKQLYSRKELAQYCGVNIATIDNYCRGFYYATFGIVYYYADHHRLIPYDKEGRTYLYVLKDFKAYQKGWIFSKLV